MEKTAMNPDIVDSLGFTPEHLHAIMPGKGAMSVKEFCKWAGIGRSTFYKLVADKRLKVRKIGRKNVVLVPDAIEFVKSLPKRSFK